MSVYSPDQITQITISKGIEKTNMPIKKLMALAFLGGAYIALGYLGYIKVAGSLPVEWGGLPHLIGAAVFPVGLILILLGGGELITGNMMVVSLAWFAKKITFGDLFKNMVLVTLFNLIGALFVAYLFGHVLGMTEGAFLEKTLTVANAKVDDTFIKAFVSGIGCNWLVGLGVWLCYGAKEFVGKVVGIWFPVMLFVLIGFQHVVANFFIIPAAIFAGDLSVIEFLGNIGPVWLGNMVGGATLIAGLYVVAYNKNDKDDQTEDEDDSGEEVKAKENNKNLKVRSA